MGKAAAQAGRYLEQGMFDEAVVYYKKALIGGAFIMEPVFFLRDDFAAINTGAIQNC
jgi:hypothetical protein